MKTIAKGNNKNLNVEAEFDTDGELEIEIHNKTTGETETMYLTKEQVEVLVSHLEQVLVK